MADINQELLKLLDGPGPQHINEQNQPEFTKGSNGAQHTKIVDSSGNPLSIIPVADSDVKAELATIKQTQADILNKLNGTIDTQLTGSIVEEDIVFERQIRTGLSAKQLTVPKRAKGMVITTRTYSSTGDFTGDNTGAVTRAALGAFNSLTAALESKASTGSVSHTLAFYNGAELGDARVFYESHEYKTSSAVVIPGTTTRVYLDITGEFAEDQGIDCETKCHWFY